MYATQCIFPEITNVKPSQNWLKCSRAVRIFWTSCMVHIKIYFEDFLTGFSKMRCLLIFTLCWWLSLSFTGPLCRRLSCSRDCCKRKAHMWVVLLPSANEVRGKVLFSQVFVCPQGGGVGFLACNTGHMTRGSASSGVCIQGGLHLGRSSYGEVCIQGCLHPEGSASAPQHYRIRSISRQYAFYLNAFYLNAFLFSKCDMSLFLIVLWLVHGGGHDTGGLLQISLIVPTLRHGLMIDIMSHRSTYKLTDKHTKLQSYGCFVISHLISQFTAGFPLRIYSVFSISNFNCVSNWFSNILSTVYCSSLFM